MLPATFATSADLIYSEFEPQLYLFTYVGVQTSLTDAGFAALLCRDALKHTFRE
jgi:hypothetical protein